MKNLILSLICILSFTTQAQDWFDESCTNIEDKVIEEEFKTADANNILKIIINQAGDVEVNGVEKSSLSEIKFKEYILDFVTNPEASKNKADRPEKVIFQIGNYQKDSKKVDKYKNYIYDVYLYLWDEESKNKYKSSYLDLSCKKREKVFNSFPLKIIGELENKKKNSVQKKRGIGVPAFGGDVEGN